jgi:hypothetical protein
MGPINRSLRAILPEAELGLLSDAIRLVVYSGLAWLTCVRFARFDLVSWLLLASACLMLTSHEGWEKYNLATLATLWYLRSLAPLDRPFELWGAARSEADTLRPPELEPPEGGES